MQKLRIGRFVFFGVALAVLGGVIVRAADGDLEVLQVRPNFYMIAGAGANIAVEVGEDGVVVVDSGSVDKAPAVVAAIKKITSAPIRYVINTSSDADHVGGNEIVAKAGQTLYLLRLIGLPAGFTGDAASILADERVLTRMSAPSGQTSPYPFAAWPTEIYNSDFRNMYLNGEGIEVIHQKGHSDGDSIVFFRKSDIIVAGDIYDTTRFPVIDIENGGSIQGEIDSLKRIANMAIASVPIISREAGTIVIPGHGHVGDQWDLVHYRDMMVIIRDHVADCLKKGMTLEQTKAKMPTLGFGARYGSKTGPWTTDKFVEAIYRSLEKAKS